MNKKNRKETENLELKFNFGIYAFSLLEHFYSTLFQQLRIIGSLFIKLIKTKVW